jgi:hypothetical protein
MFSYMSDLLSQVLADRRKLNGGQDKPLSGFSGLGILADQDHAQLQQLLMGAVFFGSQSLYRKATLQLIDDQTLEVLNAGLGLPIQVDSDTVKRIDFGSGLYVGPRRGQASQHQSDHWALAEIR